MTEEERAARKAYNRAYYAANVEKMRAKGRAWAAANRPANNARGKAWAKANPDKIRDHDLRAYGITAEQFDAIYAAQGGKCPICTREIPRIGKARHLDHCHVTNKIRGILCMLCNFGLGKFKDDVAALRKAADYLETADTGHVVARPDRLNRPNAKTAKKKLAS